MSEQLPVAVERWKKHTMKVIRRRFGDSVDMTRVDAYLNNLIRTEMEVPKVNLVNNYKRMVASSDALATIESIESNDLIVGGAATLFVQHAISKNPFRNFIIMLRKKRSAEKKMRDTFERGKDPLWNAYNRKQGNTKIISNSLYGVLGYAKFLLHNIFMAEGITRMGRVIISTAACGFENFLADNVKFSVESEVYEYISLIIDEYEEEYQGKLDFNILGISVSLEETVERILDKCAFPISQNFRRHITAIIGRQPDEAKLLIFYKNNFLKFNRIPLIKTKIMKIVGGLDSLRLPSTDFIEDQTIVDEIHDLWKFYDTFVFHNKPIYDSVRKMAYQPREAVLYIDTDSNFIALNRWVDQVQNEFFEGNYPQDTKENVFICANLLTIFLTIVVDRNLKRYAKNCGISDEWAQYLSMKNEFFFWRIIFSEVKKRYIDLQMIQEGKLLKDGIGLPEIKGYDFQKSVTKEYISSFYTKMCMDDILSPDKIDLRLILTKIDSLKHEMVESMRRGESQYFKQANVNPPEHYADPLRISGIKGVMLWNALCPDNPIELPSDVDLIPIKSLNTAKMREWLMRTYPAVYERLEREIFNNRNPNIVKMTLNVIAKPKNDNVPIPDWLLDVMDTDKIVNATIKLINPIMESLGVKIQRPTTNKEYLGNIVEL